MTPPLGLGAREREPGDAFGFCRPLDRPPCRIRAPGCRQSERQSGRRSDSDRHRDPSPCFRPEVLRRSARRSGRRSVCLAPASGQRGRPVALAVRQSSGTVSVPILCRAQLVGVSPPMRGALTGLAVSHARGVARAARTASPFQRSLPDGRCDDTVGAVHGAGG